MYQNGAISAPYLIVLKLFFSAYRHAPPTLHICALYNIYIK